MCTQGTWKCRPNLALLAGGVVCLLAVTVLVGWHADNPLLVQLHPVFVPTQYGSALGLLACGAGLAAHARGRRRVGQACGGVAVVVGLLAVGRLAGWLGPVFDATLFPSAAGFRMTRPAPPGLSAAVGLLLLGAALLRTGAPGRAAWRPLELGALGAALLLLVLLPLSGYLAAPGVWGRPHLGRLALHEMVGFAAGGAAVLGLACRTGGRDRAELLRWLPLGVSAFFGVATLALWQALGAKDRARLGRMSQAEAVRVRQELRDGLPAQLTPLRELADRWGRKNLPAAKRALQAGEYIGAHPGCLGLAWTAPDGRLQWAETLWEPAALERLLFDDPEQRQTLLGRARAGRDVLIAPAPAAKRRQLALAYVPSPRGRGAGGVLAVFSLPALLDAVLNVNVAPGYAVAVHDAGRRVVHGRQVAETEYRDEWGQTCQFRLSELDWRVSVWPTPAVMARERYSLPRLALLAGFLMASLLGVSAHLAVTARGRARELEVKIAERRQAEKALRESEAKYRSLVENLEQGVFLKDRAGRFLAANRRYCQGLGCGELDLIGKTEFAFYPRELAEKHQADDRRVLTEGGRLELEESFRPVGLAEAGGKEKTLRVIRTPVKDDAGEVVAVLGICWDVTEQRELESQVRQGQKMEAVGQLAGGIAHDFNNLLTAILGNLSLLAEELPPPDADAPVREHPGLSATGPARDLLAIAEQAARRAATLTSQLLGFSRRTMLRPEPMSLQTTVEEVVGILRRTIDPRIALEVRCPPDLWAVEVDPGQLNQVVMNLCLNARDAMPAGGRIELETANVTLGADDVHLQLDAREGEFVRLSVCDTGGGIAAEVRARIFEPFFTTKGPGKGTGLGLAMVFGIVQQHKGWVDCDSAVGKGTRFDIYLPRCHAAAGGGEGLPGPCPSAAPCPPPAAAATVLLADDETMVRNLGAAVLRRAGYEVLPARDGQEAVELFLREKGRIDLVILDLTMPRLSGRDAFRQIVRAEPGVRVLFASGYSAEYVSDEERQSVLGFIAKPYRIDELSRVVREALERPRGGPRRNGLAGCAR